MICGRVCLRGVFRVWQTRTLLRVYHPRRRSSSRGPNEYYLDCYGPLNGFCAGAQRLSYDHHHMHTTADEVSTR